MGEICSNYHLGNTFRIFPAFFGGLRQIWATPRHIYRKIQHTHSLTRRYKQHLKKSTFSKRCMCICAYVILCASMCHVWQHIQEPFPMAVHAVTKSPKSPGNLSAKLSNLKTRFAQNTWFWHPSKSWQFLKAELTLLWGGFHF